MGVGSRLPDWIEHEFDSLYVTCKDWHNRHMRVKYGLDITEPRSSASRLESLVDDDLSVADLRRIVRKRHVEPLHSRTQRTTTLLQQMRRDISTTDFRSAEQLEDVLERCRSHCSLCSLLSEMGDHDAALVQATAASDEISPWVDHLTMVSSDARRAIVETACLARCNIGLEQAQLGEPSESLARLYKAALTLAGDDLEGDHQIVVLLRTCLGQVQSGPAHSSMQRWGPSDVGSASAASLGIGDNRRKTSMTRVHSAPNGQSLDAPEWASAGETDDVQGASQLPLLRDTASAQAQKKRQRGRSRGHVAKERISPFVVYEDKEKTMIDRRKHLYKNDQYLRIRSNYFKNEHTLSKHCTDIQSPRRLYENVVYFSPFAFNRWRSRTASSQSKREDTARRGSKSKDAHRVDDEHRHKKEKRVMSQVEREVLQRMGEDSSAHNLHGLSRQMDKMRRAQEQRLATGNAIKVGETVRIVSKKTAHSGKVGEVTGLDVCGDPIVRLIDGTEIPFYVGAVERCGDDAIDNMRQFLRGGPPKNQHVAGT
mmetsp:Transcript_37282/g.89662  ORF Transcript_37282/g.89662 Transcript_37282/m.89662 type:complete len:540 (+) Transcript_37282:49-1668(+)